MTDSPPPSSNLASRAVRGGAVLLAGRLVVQLFVWMVTLGVARLLTPFDYGMMTSGMIFLLLADLLAEAGISRALIHKDDLQPRDIARAFTFTLGLAALLYAVLFFAAPGAAWVMGLDGEAAVSFVPFLRVLGLMLLLTPFRGIAVGLLDRRLHLGNQASAGILASAVQSALVLSLAFAGMGYWALTIAALSGRAIESLMLLRAAGWRPALAWPWPGDGLLSFGIHVSSASLLWVIYSNSDFAIVGRLFGPELLGIYALAFQLISLPVQKLTANVNQVAFPVYCRIRDDRERLRGWFLRLTVLLSVLGVPVLVGLALVADDACGLLLAGRWDATVLPLRLLAGVGAVMVTSTALPPLLNALGRPDLNTRYAAACTLVMPLGFLAGGWLYGLTGVCIAWIVLYPFLVGGYITLTRPLTGVSVFDLLRAQVSVFVATAGMIVCVLLVRGLLAGDEPRIAWLRLGLSIVAGVMSYSLYLLLFARRTVVADVRLLVAQLRGKT